MRLTKKYRERLEKLIDMLENLNVYVPDFRIPKKFEADLYAGHQADKVLPIVQEEFSKGKEHFKFNMNSWGKFGREEAHGKITCDTAACALGSAALLPWFQRRGLVPVLASSYINSYNNTEVEASFTIALKGEKYQDSFNSGAKFFGITPLASEYLFGGHELKGKTPSAQRHEVAKRVKEVIALDGEAPESYT